MLKTWQFDELPGNAKSTSLFATTATWINLPSRERQRSNDHHNRRLLHRTLARGITAATPLRNNRNRVWYVMSKKDRTDDAADIALVEEVVFSPCELMLERIPGGDAKIPDGWIQVR
jgi:hypothetical protein